MTDSPDVAIIGGGAIGCATAWYLSRAGLRVALYDRGALAGEATGVSAGILAPLAESASPGPFVGLAVAGLKAFSEDMPALVDESGLDPEYRISGVLRLAVHYPDVEALHEAAAWQSNADLGLRWLEPRQVASLEPGLARCRGALYSPHEGHVNPPRLVAALTTAAARRGAALYEHCAAAPWIENGRARGVLVGSERRPAGAVVIAAGAWSGAWDAALGMRVPVRPVKGQVALLRAVPPPVRSVVFAGHGYLVPRLDGTIYAGATQEEAGFDRRVTVAGMQDILTRASSLAPALREAEVLRMSAGLRPGSGDGLPLLGPAPGVEGVLLATGHFRNGILMSLITGRVMAALARGEQPAIDLDAFAPARFARSEVA